jgi:D-alanyl-D-alanine carboxypeptidase/D-alanyl-D-alanine-endopeptidase (penicillin-binding protein 4)
MIMRKLLLLLFIHTWCCSFAQSVNEKLSAAMKTLLADTQSRHAIVALYVVDSKSGKIIFTRNATSGLPAGSCQKIVTSIAAFELLGKNYTYKTQLGYDGKIENGKLNGNVIVKGSGDPTLGSWRYSMTKEDKIISEFKTAIKQAGIKDINGFVYVDDNLWEGESIPDGWIWQDIGSYYGAGARALNWRENQYDLVLRSGKKIGDTVTKIATIPGNVEGLNLNIELTSAAKGTGDRAYIYLPYDKNFGAVRGSIPVDEDRFVISGSMPKPARQMAVALCNELNISSKKIADTDYDGNKKTSLSKVFYTHISPSLDSINYWFLKKSINLYGEALVKTIAYEKTKHGSTDTGVSIIRDFWSKHGVEKTALNIIDGSGLSPSNRLTASALTTMLQYAKNQSWYSPFYDALPEIHGIKMKSGSIGGVLAYAGYIKSKEDREYTFAFIIDNFNGEGSSMREKIWKLLDVLK